MGAMKAAGNRLKHEKSPYLLQHKDNPVDWWPWCDEAFEKAAREDKPVFLSIGYSTCHWCHVMEHESFEDEEVARLMNDCFVSIKVDREERPDIDHIYMTVCQMLTGHGGWPLTIIMTPDKKPFFAGTYFPKQSRFGRVGMLDLVPRVRDLWVNRRGDVASTAEEITEALVSAFSQSLRGEALGREALDGAFSLLLNNYDPENGGFGKAPKFPTPHSLLFLLRYWKRTGSGKALEMVERTLEAMRMGGIYDHVGFGFHRYSTDSEWFLPHFEKMLYDQALLAMAYTEAHQATGKEMYRKTAEEVLTYVLRDMQSAEGGFYSAEDADSEGEEGKFYLWSEAEIKSVLGDEGALLIKRVFNTTEEGNYLDEATKRRHGTNILHLKKPLEEISLELSLPLEELRLRLNEARDKLFKHREKRVHPLKDDKILTDWNGLMISALAKAYGVISDDGKYLEAPMRAADFVLEHMTTPEGKLLHRYREGEAGIEATANDYAFFIMGLIDLYEASFDPKYLKAALELNEDFIEDFWDKNDGGFFLTPSSGKELLVRPKEVYDGAIPSANSVAMLNLLRLERLTGKAHLGEMAAKIASSFSQAVSRFPAGYTQLMIAVDFALGPSYEVVLAGNPDSEPARQMAMAIRKAFTPNTVRLFKIFGDDEICSIAPYTAQLEAPREGCTAYVCRNFACELPIADTQRLLEVLGTTPQI
jgi:uncharacterized protein YyaL (SSP411 family)